MASALSQLLTGNNLHTSFFNAQAQQVLPKLNHDKGFIAVKNKLLDVLPKIVSPSITLFYERLMRMSARQDFRIKITHSKLAQIFNRSRRTIVRWVNELKTHGLIETIRYQRQDTLFKESEYIITINSTIIDQLNALPNRNNTQEELESFHNPSQDDTSILGIKDEKPQKITNLEAPANKGAPGPVPCDIFGLSYRTRNTNNTLTHSLHLTPIYSTGVQIMNNIGDKIKNVLNGAKEKSKNRQPEPPIIDDYYPPSAYYERGKHSGMSAEQKSQILGNKLYNEYLRKTKGVYKPKDIPQESNLSPNLDAMARDIERLTEERRVTQEWWQGLQRTDPPASLKAAQKWTIIDERLQALIRKYESHVKPKCEVSEDFIEVIPENKNKEVKLEHCIFLAEQLINLNYSDQEIIEFGKQLLFGFSNRSLGKRLEPNAPDLQALAIGVYLIKSGKWLKPLGYYL